MRLYDRSRCSVCKETMFAFAYKRLCYVRTYACCLTVSESVLFSGRTPKKVHVSNVCVALYKEPEKMFPRPVVFYRAGVGLL